MKEGSDDCGPCCSKSSGLVGSVMTVGLSVSAPAWPAPCFIFSRLCAYNGQTCIAMAFSLYKQVVES